MNSFKLDRHSFRSPNKPYIIAEIGVNHEGCMDTAKHLIDEAKEGGADAAKFQTYKASKLAARQSPSYWDLSQEPTESQYKLFKKFDTFESEDYEELARYSGEVGIDFLSTPFDEESADFLNPLMPFFKIASADITSIPLLRTIAGYGKPILLSTGASTLGEIDNAIAVLENAGCKEIVLLHCVLNYPTMDQDAHLGMIEGLRRAYPNYVIGYSDHTLPSPDMLSLTTAFLLGARVIEKHFTHDKTLPGNDHYHAMDKGDLKRLSDQIDRICKLVGDSKHKHPLESETPARQNARRSIVLSEGLKAGTKLTESVLTYKRPATGISPEHWNVIIGRRVRRDVPSDHILSWEDLS